MVPAWHASPRKRRETLVADYLVMAELLHQVGVQGRGRTR